MDYIPHGDLTQYTRIEKCMPEYTASLVGRQILNAIDYLHQKGITHRDIKPDNILMGGDHPYDRIFKLADFGLSKIVKAEDTMLKTFCGTMLYLAPEVYPGYHNVKAGFAANTKRGRRHP